MSTFFEHVVDQYPPDIRKKKYEYWQKLRTAKADYDKEADAPTTQGFCEWMLNRWGVEVGYESAGFSPWHKIVDEKKHMLFEIKYGSK